MSPSNYLTVFTLDEQRFALRLASVERVFRMMEITPLPKAPEIVLGVVNLQGQIVPVVNIRKRFRLPEKEADLSDQLIVAQTPRRVIAMIVDEVSGILEYSGSEVIAAETLLPGIEYIESVVKLEDGMILIHDLDKFLSLDEEKALDEAL
ncbi:MAG: purine-binding chemotaxis protein CheW [Candidatus Tectomicrobia bacterium]|uniref:Purine-binding chemotaxis protein CheW n=1 Tax=Tectimicrobiota bacterium TaxID=2528274 RepID=A0A932CN92_UNCTE|nr:purine-binding chemotaxis protein CheW [Candidatus Tectomicrobia bacterium]